MWRNVVIVACVAGLIRWASPLPLIITNDGVEYLQWAEAIGAGEWLPACARADRTPGYPAFLAGVVSVLGASASAILHAQHALGIVTCVLVMFAAGRMAGNVVGLIAGLLCAADPYLLSLECYVLSETLSLALVSACVAMVVVRAGPARNRRGTTVVSAAAFAAVCAALLLTRPAIQVLIPFLVLAWIAGAARLRERLISAIAIVGVLAALLAPWVAANASRLGTAALAVGGGAHLWSGVARAGLLDEHVELPPNIAAAKREFLDGATIDDQRFWAFLKRIDGIHSNSATLRGWALRSIAARPAAYARAAGRTFLLQLNLPVRAAEEQSFDLHAMILRLTELGSTFQADGSADSIGAFVVIAEPSAMQKHLRSFLKRAIPGVPQAILTLGLVAGTVMAARRRSWTIAWLFTGCLAYVFVHAAMLMPDARYALPVLPTGWVAWAFVFHRAVPPRSIARNCGQFESVMPPRISAAPSASQRVIGSLQK